MIKTIMIEKEIFDEDELKIGQRVFYAFRQSYVDFDDWSNCENRCDDSGKGEIVDIDEDFIMILYNGYSQNTCVKITVDDIRSGFHKVEIL